VTGISARVNRGFYHRARGPGQARKREHGGKMAGSGGEDARRAVGAKEGCSNGQWGRRKNILLECIFLLHAEMSLVF
jgi:hypothetical protein